MKLSPVLRSGWPLLLILVAASRSLAQFAHPGALHTDADFARMSAKVGAAAEPWASGWNKLVANAHSSSTYTLRGPVAIVYRGTGYPENYSLLYNDIAAAYQNALRWQIAGDTACADKAVQIMDAWSGTLTSIQGSSDRFLAAGLYGYEFAQAAEIMRAYSGWSAAGFAQFQSMMLNVFYPMNHDFLVNHNGACISHYWANWDLCNMCSVLAIGILCDDTTLFNEAIGYFQNGAGNGSINNAVYYVHPEDMGQGQESGRDQGHATLNISLLGAFCQMAYNQGQDMFAYASSRFFTNAEYTASYNLFADVPYTTYNNCDNVNQTVISASARGSLRPSWELVYNHYVNVKGLSAPWTAQFAAQVRPEGGGGDYGPNSGGYDQLGFGTLTCTLDLAGGLPPVWQAEDIGAVGTVGGTAFDNGTYTVSGAGADIGGTADAGQFASTSLTGDGRILARLAAETIGGIVDDKVGLMIRETSAANSKRVALLLDNKFAQARLATRGSTGGGTTWLNGPTGQSAPLWLKLERAGDTFTGSISADGVTWTTVGSSTLTMAATVRVGFTACSRTTAALNTSTFDQVSVR